MPLPVFCPCLQAKHPLPPAQDQGHSIPVFLSKTVTRSSANCSSDKPAPPDLNKIVDATAVIGVNPQQMERISKVKPLSIGYQLVQGLIPRFLGRCLVPNCFQLLGRFTKIVPALTNPANWAPPFKGMSNMGFFNEPRFTMSGILTTRFTQAGLDNFTKS